jgi:hypothetical protein
MLFCLNQTWAQREYNVCDSTFYPFNADTTVIAGKRMLYIQTPGGVTPIADFTTLDTNEYIRDFDIIKPDLWYTLVGRRYIGGNTALYKSNDRGQTWTLDTSFFEATIYDTSFFDQTYYNSINQLQKMGEDTIVLFVGYYHSGLVYSVDGGNTWQEWFRNMIVHYQGILECDNYYFLYAFEGDAFSPVMFAFQKYLLFSSSSNGDWDNNVPTTYHPPCHNGNDQRCIYAPQSLSRCAQYHHFVDTLPDVCTQLLSVLNPDELIRVTLSPNPTHDFIDVKIPLHSININELIVYDYLGRRIQPKIIKITGNTYRVQMSNYTTGIYTIVLNAGREVIASRFLLE